MSDSKTNENSYKDLHGKYEALVIENRKLKEENNILKARFNVQELQVKYDIIPTIKIEKDTNPKGRKEVAVDPHFAVNKFSDSRDKVRLYMSLFRGREDVYAKRWENPKKGTSGYSPACANEWKPNLCLKPGIPCSQCKNKDYLPLTVDIVEEHLRGRNNTIIGAYPLLPDETCYFLAIDFDEEDWQKDVFTLREVCSKFKIPAAFERSRSGNGAHVWFFFSYPVSAVLARKLGSALLTYAMSLRHDISFKSYDRLFPNQDTMPKGGFGNLIALPLQKNARKRNSTVFLDEQFFPYEDQWAYLNSVRKLTMGEVENHISELCQGNELGVLKIDDEEGHKPWETFKNEIKKEDFPRKLEIVKANMLYVPKADCAQRALNQLKRLAAFKNPEFFKTQAMRMPTYNKPRIISCSDETTAYLALPRGCEEDILELSENLNLEVSWIDKTNVGRSINIKFNGLLKDQQPKALETLMAKESGILCGATAFGKSVTAIKLIAERKTNTLILVNRISLLAQWKNKLEEFLTINETIPEKVVVKGKEKKKTVSVIGILGGGNRSLHGVVDIAVMQSLVKEGEVDSLVKDYGMVIVDECHHVSAYSFELILKNVNARFVYGLTATPTRKDGHHPIIFMQCGPIRFRDNEKRQAARRPFDHYIIPRYTSFMMPELPGKEASEYLISDVYAEIVTNEVRNKMIIDDVVDCVKEGRSCIILTERTKHVEILAERLSLFIPGVISVRGAMGTRKTRERLAQIMLMPSEKPLTIVATGRYIGEGFDVPRLDTLFLAMPVAWKGTLQQYAGRLHRIYEGKKEVLIYDYVDIKVRMLERMYSKRLVGYASIGYKQKEDKVGSTVVQKSLTF